MSKHTDSVEARFNAKFNTHPYDKAQHIEYKAKEIIRFIKSEIKKSNSQQVEEAVERVAKAIYDEMVCDDPRGKPDWVPRGNLIKQVEARRKALQALTPHPTEDTSGKSK